MNWIKIYTSSPSFSVFVNGVPKGFFKVSRGLRKGDPLSPYLFIMVVNYWAEWFLSQILWVLSGALLFLWGAPSIFFIQFADDSLFMLKVEVEEMGNLRCILLIMEATTSLKVIWSKSTVSPISDVPFVGEVTSILCCDIAPLPISYLGLPLSAEASSKAIWNLVIEKLGRRLSTCK